MHRKLRAYLIENGETLELDTVDFEEAAKDLFTLHCIEQARPLRELAEKIGIDLSDLNRIKKRYIPKRTTLDYLNVKCRAKGLGDFVNVVEEMNVPRQEQIKIIGVGSETFYKGLKLLEEQDV